MVIMQQMFERECQRWESKGINITYQIKENRTTYKAGALKEGLSYKNVARMTSPEE
jgi:beta-mannan synthase